MAEGERTVTKPLAVARLGNNFGEYVCLAVFSMSQFGKKMGLLAHSKECSLVSLYVLY